MKGRAMRDSHRDDYSIYDEAPLPVAHATAAAEAIREATYRMQLAQDVPEQLDVHNLAAVGAALEDITRGLAQFAGQVAEALPDSVDQHLRAAQEIRDGLVAFRIAVLDANTAARSLGSSATSVSNSAVPHQRRT
jgi:TRAP-type mannitol/chloroaromatic compound transport system substrate-binding protein